jgi:Ca-activated chloride channel family protein
VDASGSMAVSQRIENGVHALRKVASGLTDGDELAVIRFADQVKVMVPWTRTPDVSRLSWKLDPGAGSMANSSITDAVKAALELSEQSSNPRRVILVISDGFENTSATPLSRLVSTQQQSEVLIYAFGMFGREERAPGGGSLRNILPALVGETGGVFWNVASPTDAEFAAMSLLNELKYQMSLGYTPIRPFDGTFRRIKVETTVKGLAVRHRGGYLALPTIK